jgi:hypothetical protein
MVFTIKIFTALVYDLQGKSNVRVWITSKCDVYLKLFHVLRGACYRGGIGKSVVTWSRHSLLIVIIAGNFYLI